MKSQYDRIGKLIKRKSGATSIELALTAPSLSIHKRLSEMKRKGWTITRKWNGKISTYYGKEPK